MTKFLLLNGVLNEARAQMLQCHVKKADKFLITCNDGVGRVFWFKNRHLVRLTPKYLLILLEELYKNQHYNRRGFQGPYKIIQITGYNFNKNSTVRQLIIPRIIVKAGTIEQWEVIFQILKLDKTIYKFIEVRVWNVADDSDKTLWIPVMEIANTFDFNDPEQKYYYDFLTEVVNLHFFDLKKDSSP